jgi:beta-lactamase regulating signal transducer with metallopeptidase domain
MIALWMLYACVLALWLALAGLLLERTARAFGRATRVLWFVVLLSSALLPPILAILSSFDSVASPVVAQHSATGQWRTLVDRVLVAGWLLGSLTALLLALLAQGALLRGRRAWQSATVLGEQVLLASDFGPGVVALGRARIVLPQWALQLDDARLELLLRHESEHVRARDHWLVLAALALLVLFPFNPILWWQYRRLKLVIEMDCDARVLSGRQNVREYAALLLDVGARSRAARLLCAAFAAPPHALERRIRTMLKPKTRISRAALALGAAGVVVCIALACETPGPSSPEPALRSVLGSDRSPPPSPPPQGAANSVSEPEYELRSVDGGEDVEVPIKLRVYEEEVTLPHASERVRQLPPPPPPPPRPGSDR